MSYYTERGFYLTYVSPKHTGLTRVIAIGEKYLEGFPRIEIEVEGRKPVHVLIKDVPECSKSDVGVLPDEELKRVYQWVCLNKEILLEHWNLRIDSLGLLNGLKPLEDNK